MNKYWLTWDNNDTYKRGLDEGEIDWLHAEPGRAVVLFANGVWDKLDWNTGDVNGQNNREITEGEVYGYLIRGEARLVRVEDFE